MTTNPFLAAARSLAGEIEAQARVGEAERKMPDALVDAIRSAGLFHLGVPSALGGARVERVRGRGEDTSSTTSTIVDGSHSIVDRVYSLSGGGAVYDHNVIQRCARDVQAGTQHIFFAFTQWRDAGRVLFGMPPEGPRV